MCILGIELGFSGLAASMSHLKLINRATSAAQKLFTKSRHCILLDFRMFSLILLVSWCILFNVADAQPFYFAFCYMFLLVYPRSLPGLMPCFPTRILQVFLLQHFYLVNFLCSGDPALFVFYLISNCSHCHLLKCDLSLWDGLEALLKSLVLCMGLSSLALGLCVGVYACTTLLLWLSS